jgi:hypothetical protein
MSDGSCGYILWCPDFFNGPLPGDDRSKWEVSGFANCFLWQNNQASREPQNFEQAGFLPYGCDTDQIPAEYTYDTTRSIADPAAHLLASDLVADARTMAACIALTYYGRMDSAAGEIGVIENLPIEELLTGSDGAPLNVDQLMTFSNDKRRLGIDTIETIYRPSEKSTSVFRSNERGMFYRAQDTPEPTILADQSTNFGPRVFGFVWRNVVPGAGLAIDLTKCIEWRPEANSGLTQVPIHTHGISPMPAVIAKIDRIEATNGHPIWTRMKAAGKSFVSKVAQMAQTGTGEMLMDRGKGYVAKKFMSEFLTYAPAALAIL